MCQETQHVVSGGVRRLSLDHLAVKRLRLWQTAALVAAHGQVKELGSGRHACGESKIRKSVLDPDAKSQNSALLSEV